MSLFDVVKQVIGGADQPTDPLPMAQITIISTDSVSPTTESQPEPGSG